MTRFDPLDSADSDPPAPATSGDIDFAKIGRAIVLVVIFGETGLPDGLCYRLVGEETTSAPYYMVGSEVFGAYSHHAMSSVTERRDHGISAGEPQILDRSDNL